MSTQARQTLRLGRISYLNVLPIYHPLEKGEVANDFRIVSGPPARLNELMSRGELDISAASSFEYARNFQKYLLVPDLAIGSQGPVQSVLLLSRTPLSRLEEEPILVSSQTHTSAALLRLILKERLHLDPGYQTGNITAQIGSPNPPAAFLAIGDEALRLRNLPDYPYRLDLGQAWLEWTGLPFIFGVWIINRDSLRTREMDIQLGCRKILAAKTWGIKRIAFFSELISKKGILNREEVFSYLQGLVYDFSEREQKGLKLFFDLLAKSGTIGASPDLNFFSAV
ncbi:MAG: menaquinone biosynthesis protein [Desulfohalobiaceae bacterium]|nr:menaquinone biosynthesis protein [Desulfohalobiaceae bacterium]